MTTLKNILSGIETLQVQGNLNTPIAGIQFDSRAVDQGDLFVAARGVSTDGHQFIDKAIAQGAAAVVCEQMPENQANIPYVLVRDSSRKIGELAANFYDHPSQKLTLVGVTGTNGKTTTATLLWQLFTGLGYKTGLIGTVENRVGDAILPSTHTTPDPVKLQEMLAQMADAGCTYVFMEVSSHAIHQHRIAGAVFAGGLFTNLTHDHLDYHKSFAEYRDAKKMFFDNLSANAFAIYNADDKNGTIMMQNTAATRKAFGLKNIADFKGKIIENGLSGLHMEVEGVEIFARMIGEFNASNLMAAYAVARMLHQPQMDILTVLSNLRGAEGRFDYIVHPQKSGCIGVVDYAHTPDALEKILETIAKLKKKDATVITVTGAGGDRDKTKRPIMARISATLSDQLILTSDNPRTEDLHGILRDMEAGLSPELMKKALTISDREQAIKTAVQLAGTDTIILVAGKGHEKYQDINGVKYPFDDKQVLMKYFEI